MKYTMKISTFIAEVSDTHIICSSISHFVKHWYCTHLSNTLNWVPFFCVLGQRGCQTSFVQAHGTNTRTEYNDLKHFEAYDIEQVVPLVASPSRLSRLLLWCRPVSSTHRSCKALQNKLCLSQAITSQLKSTHGRWYIGEGRILVISFLLHSVKASPCLESIYGSPYSMQIFL